FKGFNIYNATSYVQDHTLINRGITTLGGSTAPQCIMSNNKYEAQERALMGGIYFVASYLTPILLIPVYNKHFLKNKGITKALNGAGNKIIEMSKQYLTPDADILKGLHKTAKRFDKADDWEFKKAFDEIYNRYNNPDKLKKDLLSVHQKVLTTDFITTAMMWSSIPWIATEFTEHRTKRHDFSAGFKLKESSLNDNNVKKSKIKKALWNVFFTTVPALVFAKTVTRGIGAKSSNKILKTISENAHNFDYTSGTNMSKTIYAAIWLLSSFPAKIISSRDANERKDRALRDAGLFTMFFGGDFLINNISGRLADRFLGTKIMNGDVKELNFFQRFKLQLKNFRKLDEAKDLPPEILKKTKSVGAGLYWFALLTNTALIGFGLPKVLNKFLRYNIGKENSAVKNQPTKTFGGISMSDFVNFNV
ncbi:MAG: hypothetical protein J6W96_06000, partial [Alphaproteobacteria bacterium]|nr:hypothetical protein [Alphaproteobacteria bacterium]